MASSNEYQLTFSQYTDAKTMFVAIETQFGGSRRLLFDEIGELITMSIDDLYNNFKIVEQSVKKSVGASSGAQNLAFMTAPSTSISTASFSDNDVYAFMVENPNGSNLLHQDLEQIHEDDLEAMDLKWQLSLLSMREKRECRAPRNKEGQFRNQDNTRKHENNKDTSLKAMLAIDGVGFDWSEMAEEQVQTNMALMAFLDSEDPEFKSYGFEDSKQESNIVCDKKSDASKENSNDSLVKEQVSEDTSSFVESPLNVDKETAHYKYHQKERMVYRNNYNWVNYNYTTNKTYLNAQWNMVPRAVLMKTSLKPFNTARTVNTAHPKSIVFSATSMSHFSKSAQSTGKPQQDDTGFIDSGCSRHMIGNIAYLSDFKEFDGGYVTFGGGAHGGRISGKGTLKTDSLDFEDVGGPGI
ncbi:hypothetical protein Tco_0316092 [Tanacetum coccineum]